SSRRSSTITRHFCRSPRPFYVAARIPGGDVPDERGSRLRRLGPERQDVKTVVLKLQVLLDEPLDPMPAVSPRFRACCSPYRLTTNVDASSTEYGTVDEGGSPASQSRRHHEDGLHMSRDQVVPDLIGRIQRDGFLLGEGNDLEVAERCHVGHDTNNAF